MSTRDDELIDLLTTHKRQVFSFIFGIVHSLQDAEDVFQQTSVYIWQEFDQFEVGTDFVAWACSIARFKALNFLRAKRREKAVFSSRLVEAMADRQRDESALFEARANGLRACKEKLSDRDRKILEACYAPGATIKRTAEEFGRSPSSVRTSLTRIRRSLAKCIEKQMDEGSEV